MKRFLYAGCIAFLSLLLTQCTEDGLTETDTHTPSGPELVLSFNPMEETTRTTVDGQGRTSWSADDALLCFITESGKVPQDWSSVRYRFVTDQKMCLEGRFCQDAEEQKTRPVMLEKGKEYDWYVCTPYIEGMKAPAGEEAVFSFDGQTMDWNAPTAHLGTADLMCGTALGCSDATVLMDMNHLGTLMKFNVKNTEAEPFQMSSISFGTSSGALLAGSCSVDLTKGTISPVKGKDKAELRFINAQPLAQNESKDIFIMMPPFRIPVGDSFIVNATAADRNCSLTYRMDKDLGFKANTINTADIVLNGSKAKESFYTRVAGPLTDWSGDYLITYTKENTVIVMNGMNGEYATGQDISSALTPEGIPSADGDAYKATVSRSGSGYNINVTGIGYIGYIGSDNKLMRVEKDDARGADVWHISYDDGIELKPATNSGVSLNWNNGSPRFACYKPSSRQQPVTLYKRNGSDVPGGNPGGGTEEPDDPDLPGITTATIAEFLKAPVSETVWYKLKGEVTDITNTTYGNFILKDETGSVYVYGLTAQKCEDGHNDQSFSTLNLKEGDILTLVGTRDYYKPKDSHQVGGPAYYISHKSQNPGGGNQPDPDQGGGTNPPVTPDVNKGGNRNGYLMNWEIPHADVSLGENEAYSRSVNEKYGNSLAYVCETSDPDQLIVTHTFADGSRHPRNYSILFDKNKKASLWVAFGMHSSTWDGNAGRNDGWTNDPAIPASWQSPGVGSPYSRGHQIASSDRQRNKGANQQTFYHSNQTPQWQTRFNDGVWNQLERAIQDGQPSGRDTLYIVTGPYYENSKTVRDKSGNSVPCPSGFWKCIMKCSFDTNGKMISAKGIGYSFPKNDQYTNARYSDYATTIDAIESRTGFDLYANIPEELQAAAEKNTSPVL